MGQRSHHLFLHVGTHKTGTTSIQKSCRNAKAKLKKCGLVYPKFPGGSAGHHHLAHALADQGSPFVTPQVLADFTQEVHESLKTHNVLISAEPFYRHTLGLEESEENVWEAKDRYIARVRGLFGDVDPIIVAYVRRQDALAPSLFNESVLQSGYTETLETFCESRTRFLDYKRNFHLWATHFGAENIRLFPYEPSIRGAAHVELFLERLGCKLSFSGTGVGEGEQNRSLPGHLVELKRQVNRYEFNGRQSRLVRKLFESIFVQSDLDAAARSLFEETESPLKILQRMIGENAALRPYFANADDFGALASEGRSTVTTFVPRDEAAVTAFASILHATILHQFGVIAEKSDEYAEALLRHGASKAAVAAGRDATQYDPIHLPYYQTLCRALIAQEMGDLVGPLLKKAEHFLQPWELARLQEQFDAVAVDSGTEADAKSTTSCR